MSHFRITYSVDDGYAGQSRPQHVTVRDGDLNGSESEEELRNLYWELVDEDFQMRISAYGENEDEFVEWALRANKDNTEAES